MGNYAVIFKTHSWSQIIEDLFLQLKKNVSGGDLYIQIDNTNINDEINIDFEKISYINEEMIENIGLPRNGSFWWNGDYATILFFLENPNYDYYVSIEYDVFVSNSIDNIVNIMENEGIDIVGQKILGPLGDHLKDCVPYYGINTAEKSLFCISFFSKLAISCIYSRRLAHSKIKKKFNLSEWPIGEAVMGTEFKLSNLEYRDLVHFCDNLDHYDWNKGSMLDYAKHVATKSTFIHPVSDSNKFSRTNFDMLGKINDQLLQKVRFSKDPKLFFSAYHLEKTQMKIEKKY